MNSSTSRAAVKMPGCIAVGLCRVSAATGPGMSRWYMRSVGNRQTLADCSAGEIL